jgi:predicted nicotinamide N-methyase
VADRSESDVLAQTRLVPVPLLPEIRTWQAAESTGLWELAGGNYHSDRPPPLWAFAWAGGQALARYVLDHPEVVAGRRVLDLAAGSGLVAIAAAKAGAAEVRAVDTDPAAVAAIAMNAGANRVAIETSATDVLDGDAGPAEVILAGDAFYQQAMADRVARFLRRAAKEGVTVLVGDPDRGFLPRRLFRSLATYQVPVPLAVESTRVKATTVWELRLP